jgi:hypothetical protein
LQNVAAEIFAAHTGKTLATVEQWFAIQPGYATPKVDVRGACFRDGKVLLVLEKRTVRGSSARLPAADQTPTTKF